MIIGTHNSSSYTIDFSVNFFKEKRFGKWNLLRLLARISFIAREKIRSLTQNQKYTIYEQLDLGAQLLDIYVSYCSDNSTFYCSHTFATVTLVNVLRQIAAYISLHPNRLIYILLRPDFENSATILDHEEELLDIIKRELPFNNIVWYYKPIAISLPYIRYPDIIPFSELNMDWYDTDNVEDFVAKFNQTNYSDTSGLYCVLTPSSICQDLKAMASKLNPVMRAKIRTLSEENKPRMIAFDYITSEELNL